MLKIKQIDLLEQSLNNKIETDKILETDLIISDPYWSSADDYYIPTQLTIKEYITLITNPLFTIGIPTDGSYTDGFYSDWDENILISDAIDNINEILLDLIPEKAGLLTSTDLIGPTLFSGKLPSNLPNESLWITDGMSPGNTITKLIDTNSVTLINSDISTNFHGGYKKNYPTELIGSVYAYQTINSTFSAVTDTRDLSSLTGGVGTTGILEITDIAIYNIANIKVNASIVSATITEGFNQFKLAADNSVGETNSYKIYYTGLSFPNQSFNVTPVLTENAINYIYLSGIQYYAASSTFNLSYTINDLYYPVYTTGNQSIVTSDYFTTINKNYTGIPNYNSQLIVTNESITISSSISSNENIGTGTVTLYKPNKTNVTEVFNIGTIPINTKGTVSTSTVEEFYDEGKRYESHTVLSWTSSNLFSNTEGQLEVQNGRLIDPRFSGNYLLYTETENYYRRSFSNRTINIDNGTLLIEKSGTLGNPTPWLNTGGGKFQISMWIQRGPTWTQYDLGTGIGLAESDGGEGILDETNSSDGIINWVLNNEYIKMTDVVILDIKFDNTISTDYITRLEMVWE